MNKKHRILGMLIVFSLNLTFFNQRLDAQTTSPAPYCVADFDDYIADVPDAIFGVSIGTLNNLSMAQCAYPHYIFYNNITAPDLSKGSSYPLTIYFDVHGGCGYGVWIDYNHDNLFDSTEKVIPAGGVALSYPGDTIVQNVTISATALTGITRMRVRVVEDDFHNGTFHFVELPCNLSTSSTDVMDWGETEDYNVNITGPAGIDELQADDISLYPNPSSGIFSLQFPNNQSYSVEVYNVAGDLICKKEKEVNSTNYQLDLSKQGKGIYFIKITGNNNKTTNKKIVVQ